MSEVKYTIEEAENSRAWPFIEAAKLLKKLEGRTPKKGYVLFVTGYGPSGLPHIGTFAEVLRTTMVRRAFMQLCDIPTRLICFSDDLDGLRKVPTNLPNQEMLSNYLDYPLTRVPDPFGETSSYGAYMNKKLCSFLDKFGFEYEFASATEYYTSGKFDFMLLKVLEKYEQIMQVMLPTLGEERQATYSPFLPICPKTNKVLQAPVLEVKPTRGTIVYKNLSNELVETKVTKGKCKLQWKPDFAMRWAALDVDYEMYGKDHLPNSRIYSRICEILGGTPPVQLFYELFLNEEGQKISKSKGNSLTIDDWLIYAPVESMALFMYQHPSRAKKLYFAVIPKAVDEYLTLNRKYHQSTDLGEKLSNPVYHIHRGKVPYIEIYDLTFSLILNLATVCNPENEQILWQFIRQYASEASPATAPYLSQLLSHAIEYYNAFIRDNKKYLLPDAQYRIILTDIITALESLNDETPAVEIQKQLYDIGMKYAQDLKEYFSTLYQILLGQVEGPRLGSFIKLYTIKHSINLIKSKLAPSHTLT